MNSNQKQSILVVVLVATILWLIFFSSNGENSKTSYSINPCTHVKNIIEDDQLAYEIRIWAQNTVENRNWWASSQEIFFPGTNQIYGEEVLQDIGIDWKKIGFIYPLVGVEIITNDFQGYLSSSESKLLGIQISHGSRASIVYLKKGNEELLKQNYQNRKIRLTETTKKAQLYAFCH